MARAAAMAPPIDPAEALNGRGMALRQARRLHEALASYEQALAIRPDFPEALNNRGNVLFELGRFDAALASYDRALAARPDYPEAFNNRGNVLRELRRLDEALASHDRALALRPHYASAFNNCGLVLRELGRLDEALDSYDQALAIRPDHAEAACNRSIVLRELGRLDAALASCDRALAIRPDYAEALTSRGIVLRELGRLEEALANCDRALAISPDYTDALVNRGIVLQYLGRIDDAVASYARAQAIDPTDPAAHWNEAFSRLLAGDFAAGFSKYEWRVRRELAYPLWLGEPDISRKTILLHAEQGFGDTIQFCRYAPLLAERGARVILQVQPALKSLLSESSGMPQVVANGEKLPEFDFHCPLPSLPLAFGTTLQTIPARIPYLTPSPSKVQYWRARLPAGTPRIGLAWSGNPSHMNDRNRSIALRQLVPLLDCGATFISLQKDLRDDDRQWLAAHQALHHFGDDFFDFSDTAAVISLLDLVITVDTAVAHLAGAMGKPVWIMLSATGVDWRWLLHREDNPWYPSVRLFRQTSIGDWDGVIERIGNELRSSRAVRMQRAVALHRQGDFANAERLYCEIIAQAPDYFDALHLCGLAAAQGGRFAEAEQLIGRALSKNPNHADALNIRAEALRELGRLDEALASCDRALAIRPDYPEAHNNRGNILAALHRFDEALASHDRALALRPDYPAALNSRGNALRHLKRFDAALASYDRVLAMLPNTAETLCNRGIVLRELRRLDEALVSYDRALAIRPDYADALNSRGIVLRELGRLDEALTNVDRALAIRPAFAEALTSRGTTLVDLKRLDEALASFRRAQSIRPDYADAHWSESLCHLLAGDLAAGWAKHEWRWRTEQAAGTQRSFEKPLWLGEPDISGKTLLLTAEQGFGDTIQFCRYAPLLAEHGVRIVMEVQPSLKSLLSSLTGVQQLVAKGEKLPEFDFHCPLLSLPLAFGTTLQTIPARVPYLMPAKLPAGAPRIGLAWSGNPKHGNDRNRSIALHRLAPLLDCGATFVSLQKDVREDDRQWLDAHPEIQRFEFFEFAETAAVISQLDLVISVDTSVAHLAGAMAKPVWILLPAVGVDWRWMLEREDSPWYPTARLFRQPSVGDWDSVIERIARGLRVA